MIRVIQSFEVPDYQDNIDDYFKIRAKVFKDRLGWDVHVEDGMEIDTFDAEDPTYLLIIDENTGAVLGGVRLLPTTGPNMLRDVFFDLMGNAPMVESPLIWESSRFCVDPDLEAGDGGLAWTRKLTTDLLYAACEVGMNAGLSHIVTVYSVYMKRLFRQVHCHIEEIGGPIRYGKENAYAGMFEMGQPLLDALAAKNNIPGSRLEVRDNEKLAAE